MIAKFIYKPGFEKARIQKFERIQEIQITIPARKKNNANYSSITDIRENHKHAIPNQPLFFCRQVKPNGPIRSYNIISYPNYKDTKKPNNIHQKISNFNRHPFTTPTNKSKSIYTHTKSSKNCQIHGAER